VSVPELAFRLDRIETDTKRLTGAGGCARLGRTVALTVAFGVGGRVTLAGGCSGALGTGLDTTGGTDVGELADLRPGGGLVTDTDADADADERGAACVL
jgi:hypothetical protein